MEIYKTQTVFVTEMECPVCKKGQMQFTGVVAHFQTQRFMHICGACGYKDAYERPYPSSVMLTEHENLREDAQ